MLKAFFNISVLVCLVLMSSMSLASDEYWTDLNAPYWANGIDVAVGQTDTSPGIRYLIGSNNENTNLMRWNLISNGWDDFFPISSSVKLVSYKRNNQGLRAFCAQSGGDVYRTNDGGISWDHILSIPANTNYSAIDVTTFFGDPGQYIFAGMASETGHVSAYLYDNDYQNGTWFMLGDDTPQNNLLYEKDVFDVECSETRGVYAGTEDGLYFHDYPADPQNQNPWQHLNALQNCQVRALESIDDMHGEQLAAVIDPGQNRKLYFSGLGNIWENPIELKPRGESFEKPVNDIAGVYWYNDHVSCYAATSDGLYSIYFQQNTTGDCDEIDIANYANVFNYDKNFIAVDYYFYDDENKHAKVIASTPNSVYEIHEERDNNGTLVSIEVTEITNGTYKCDAAALTFPEYVPGVTRKVFMNTPEGLIKKGNLDDWKLCGLSNLNHSSYIGTDVVSEPTGNGIVIAASSASETANGMIIYSGDYGVTWQEPELLPNSIRSLALSPHSDEAYAGGYGQLLYHSSDNGQIWSGIINMGELVFVNDILVDPDPNRQNYIYVAGSVAYGTTTKIKAGNGGQWYDIENGLSAVNNVYQLCKNADDDALYAATDDGIYKADISNLQNVTWVRKTDEIGNPAFASIVNDPNEKYVLFGSTYPGIGNPHVYVSADSGRSWNDYTQIIGDDDADISKLAFSQSAEPAVIAGTEKGLYFVPDIVKSGNHDSHLEWGPGKIIVNGDVSNWLYGDLEIVNPCTLLFVYDFARSDCDFGWQASKSELFLKGNTVNEDFIANGSQQDKIIFTSSHTTNPQPGDWGGITVCYNSHPCINMQHCKVEYADYGIISHYAARPYKFEVTYCEFKDMVMGGVIVICNPLYYSTIVNKCTFENCGGYALELARDKETFTPSPYLTNNTIINSTIGLIYAGSGNSTDSRKAYIEHNVIQDCDEYGILVSISYDAIYPPRVEINDNTLTNIQGTGIQLFEVSDKTVIGGNELINSGNYGVYITNSSPVLDEYSGSPNIIKAAKVGIYCDGYSGPYVRNTVIRNSINYGILAEVKEPPVTLPNFGDVSDPGNNSFTYINPSAKYRDISIKYDGAQYEVLAQGNWWGEYPPNATEITGYVTYDPALDYDPWKGYGKRVANEANIPTRVTLDQNYPNPFNPSTDISLYIPETQQVSVDIYNIRGQVVKNLISEILSIGHYTIHWDGKNENNNAVASGIYFYVLTTDDEKVTKKMTLLR